MDALVNLMIIPSLLITGVLYAVMTGIKSAVARLAIATLISIVCMALIFLAMFIQHGYRMA